MPLAWAFFISLEYEFRSGEWMISTVRMIAAADHADADWESYWGNLTLSLKP